MAQPVFVTSIPRSGSTWIGQVFAAAAGTSLVHEPFNWKKHPDRAGYHMKYMPAGSQDARFVSILRGAMGPQPPTRTRRRAKAQLRALLGRIMSSTPLLSGLGAGPRHVVVKDVHACLALEYIWEKLHPLILIVVRHPFAVADSWARLGYEVRFRLDILLGQGRLLHDHLAPFENHMNSTDDYFFEIGAYWGAAYFVLSRLADRHKEWHWVTHESLCVQPVTQFKRLFEDMGLRMNQRAHDFLVEHNVEGEAHEDPYSLTRVSAREPGKWRATLTAQQIQAVTSGVEPFGVLPLFYGDHGPMTT